MDEIWREHEDAERIHGMFGIVSVNTVKNALMSLQISLYEMPTESALQEKL